MTSRLHQSFTTPVLLVPGFWLGAWAWDDVVKALRARGHESVLPLTPAGQAPDDPRPTQTSHSDQAAWLLDRVHECAEPPVLVAHSGASFIASGVLDASPDSVARVVYIDGGPLADGATFDATLPEEAAELPLPPFEVLERASSLAGLSGAQREEFRRRAVPQPGRVVREPLHLSNPERRHRVPTTIIACSIPSEQIRSLAAARHPMFAEVATLTDLRLMDLPTGHWPMWSRPDDLAEVISQAVTRPDA
jgi:pimeloyl-ACP methyl ester carboxylesterase